MGGAIKSIISGVRDTLDNQWDNVRSGNFREALRDPAEVTGYLADPGGLFLQSGDEGLAKLQAAGDIGNIGAKPAQAADAAEDAAKEQERLIAEQQALVDAETAKQKKITDERTARMKQNQLLSGSETGLSSSGRTTLLG